MGGPLVIHDSNIASSSCGIFACSPPLFSPCNIDLSNDLNHEDPISNDVPTLEIDFLNVQFKLDIKKGILMPLKSFKTLGLQKFCVQNCL